MRSDVLAPSELEGTDYLLSSTMRLEDSFLQILGEYQIKQININYVAVQGRCAARVCGVSIVGKPSIARIFPYKKHSLAEFVSTIAKLCVPMNMIGGRQTHP
ncbi:hypothetical protein SFRURICE_000684 [Spodoptera frugiperda]|nr:hypothetical protein SFRURICE_000684 [Spodoptera frugiperda]